ncbi:MAG: DUF5317 domain-containing protein [Actinomycetota bacterium]
MVWLAIVLFLSMAVALLRGGRLINLGDIELRLWWLLPLGLGLQFGVAALPSSWADWEVGLILISYAPLLAVVILNRHRPGLWLAGIGVLMNFTVIALNGGMPVLTEAAEVASGFANEPLIDDSYKHVIMDARTRLAFLGDVIPLRLANEGQVLSLGDVLLAIGLGRFVEFELRRPVRWFKRGAQAKAGSALRY